MRLRPVLLGAALVTACGPGPRFASPRTLTATGGENPTIAVDRHGTTVYVVWAQARPDSGHDVMLARLDVGGGTTPPVRVNDRPGEVTTAQENPPQVRVGPDGTVFVAWVSDRSPQGARHSDAGIRLAMSRDSGRTFSASRTVDPLSPGGPRSRTDLYYDLAAAADGALYVSWLDLHYYADSVAAREARHAPDPEAAPENRVDVRVARSRDGGRSFVAAPALDTSACICCRTAIAAGGATDHRVHVVWRHVFAGSVRDFVASRSDDAATSFAPPARVHEDHWVLNGCPDIGPDVAVDDRGQVHVAWYTGAEGRLGLWYAVSRDGGGRFDAPIPLLTDRYVPSSHVKLAVVAGEPWAVWEDLRRKPTRLVLGRPGGSTQRLGVGSYPAIAAGDRTLAVAWQDAGAIRVRLASVRSNPR
ncbi:MAG TPA: sialidase family protein [Gemmatimonadales bacterium]|nr:sialidase family protein [Gemmatimonadales bacterium]